MTVDVHLHTLWLDTADPLGPPSILPDHNGLPPLTWDGVASDGRPCEALSVTKDLRCPKPSAVALLVLDERPVALCGGHYGVHRRGNALVLPERGR